MASSAIVPAAMPSRIFPLLSLPNEILIMVLSQLRCPKTLQAVILACSHLRAVAEPLLYRSIFLRSPTQLSILARSTFGECDRASYVRTLSLASEWELDGDREAIEPLLTKLERLRELNLQAHDGQVADRARQDEEDNWCRSLEEYRKLF